MKVAANDIQTELNGMIRDDALRAEIVKAKDTPITRPLHRTAVDEKSGFRSLHPQIGGGKTVAPLLVGEAVINIARPLIDRDDLSRFLTRLKEDGRLEPPEGDRLGQIACEVETNRQPGFINRNAQIPLDAACFVRATEHQFSAGFFMANDLRPLRFQVKMMAANQRRVTAEDADIALIGFNKHLHARRGRGMVDPDDLASVMQNDRIALCFDRYRLNAAANRREQHCGKHENTPQLDYERGYHRFVLINISQLTFARYPAGSLEPTFPICIEREDDPSSSWQLL